MTESQERKKTFLNRMLDLADKKGTSDQREGSGWSVSLLSRTVGKLDEITSGVRSAKGSSY